MQKGLFIRICVLFVASAAFPADINAQNSSLQRTNLLKEIVFKGNHIQFNFSVLSTFKARLSKTTGDYPADASAVPGLVLAFKYVVNFNNYYSLLTGPEATIAGRNIIVSFYKNDFYPPLIKDYHFKGIDTYLADLILSLPVLLERRIFYSSTKYVFLQAGARLNISTGADADYFDLLVMDTNNNVYHAANVDVMANNNAKPWISFAINFGHSWLLRNNNGLQIAIISNISFTKYVNGIYQVTLPNQPLTEGLYSSTASYIGLSMNYVFTNANYRIRRLMESR